MLGKPVASGRKSATPYERKSSSTDIDLSGEWLPWADGDSAVDRARSSELQLHPEHLEARDSDARECSSTVRRDSRVCDQSDEYKCKNEPSAESEVSAESVPERRF